MFESTKIQTKLRTQTTEFMYTTPLKPSSGKEVVHTKCYHFFTEILHLHGRGDPSIHAGEESPVYAHLDESLIPLKISYILSNMTAITGLSIY
jgi:hypothetical protein